MIGQIKNIRFTYQFTSANVSLVRNIGRAVRGRWQAGGHDASPLCPSGPGTETMIALTSPVVPSFAGQAFTAVKAAATSMTRRLAGAWSHRHDATALAALDDR